MRWIRAIFGHPCVQAWLFFFCGLKLFRYAFLSPRGYEGLFVDTDMFSDVGLVRININGPSAYSAMATKSILGYYDKPHIHMSFHGPPQNLTYEDRTGEHGDFLDTIVSGWHDYAPLCKFKGTCPIYKPVQHYRSALSYAKRRDITIVSLGYLDDLSDLLSSTGDRSSKLSGRELIRRKVNKLVIMGGEYPRGREANFNHNSTATENVIYNWPGRIVFAGSELGRDVFSGGKLMREANATDPIKAAYEAFNGPENPSESSDPLAMLYAIEGLGDMFEHAGRGGHNHLYPNGTNAWVNNSRRYWHTYLKLKVSNEIAAQRLDDLFLQGAAKHRRW